VTQAISSAASRITKLLVRPSGDAQDFPYLGGCQRLAPIIRRADSDSSMTPNAITQDVVIVRRNDLWRVLLLDLEEALKLFQPTEGVLAQVLVPQRHQAVLGHGFRDISQDAMAVIPSAGGLFDGLAPPLR
jgi:hypothetical protein